MERLLWRSYEQDLRWLSLVLVALACLLGGGCHQAMYQASSLPPELVAPRFVSPQTLDLSLASRPTAGSALVQPGDLLEVTINSGLREADPGPLELRVGEDGAVELPLVGRVAVAGNEASQAARLVRDQCLAQNRRVQLDLAVMDQNHMANVELPDGTVVIVRERPERRIYVSGLVNRADQFEMPRDAEVRLLDALAMAGGRKYQFSDRISIVRKDLQGGQPVTIRASARRAERSGEDNIPLAPGDVVTVDETPSTLVLGLMERVIRFGLTAPIP